MNPSTVPPLDIEDFTLLLFGHAAFQYLYAGCEFRIFETLAGSPGGLSRDRIGEITGLQLQPLRCLLRGLTSLRLLAKQGEFYTNGPLIQRWIDSGQWSMIHDTVLFEACIVYEGQTDFVPSLRENRNVGLRHIPGDGRDLYHRLAAAPQLQRIFYNYMGSWSRMANPLLLASLDFSQWRHLLDVGGGDGTNAIAIAEKHPDVQITLLDLPGNGEVARRRIADAKLEARIRVQESSMFVEPFPGDHDCIAFIHQLVIWPLPTIAELVRKAYQALPARGSVVIFSSIADDSEDGPAMAALDSAYFVSIPASGGMIHTWGDYEAALRAAGFTSIERRPCQAWTPHGIIIATK